MSNCPIYLKKCYREAEFQYCSWLICQACWHTTMDEKCQFLSLHASYLPIQVLKTSLLWLLSFLCRLGNKKAFIEVDFIICTFFPLCHFHDLFFHLNVSRNLNKERWLWCFQQNCWWCLTIRWKRFWSSIMICFFYFVMCTLESGINVALRLLIFWLFSRGYGLIPDFIV